MNYKLIGVTAILIILFVSCASAGSGSNAALSLQEAIEQAAEQIAADLRPGSRVAVIAFESPNDGVSEHILVEIAGALFDRRLIVADRQNLEHVMAELDFQLSGFVSDESAQSIGRMLGAELVITGQLRFLGGAYRFQVNAINVEDATWGSVIRLDVRNDRAMQNLMSIGN